MTTRPYELNSIPLAHPRVQQLDALTLLRFFASLYVLAFHYDALIFGEMSSSGFVSLGYSGVTFFFLLSGFILSHTYQYVEFTKRQFVNEVRIRYRPPWQIAREIADCRYGQPY